MFEYNIAKPILKLSYELYEKSLGEVDRKRLNSGA